MLLLFLALRPAPSDKLLEEDPAYSEEEERGGGEGPGAGRTEGMSDAGGGMTCMNGAPEISGIAGIEPEPEPIPVLLVCLRAKTRVGWIALVVTVCAECRLRAVSGRTGTEGTVGTEGTMGTEGGMVGVLVAARIVEVNGELSSAALREDADVDCCTTGMEDNGAIFVLILFALAAGGGGGISENRMGPSCSESHLKDVRGSGRIGDGCARRWF